MKKFYLFVLAFACIQIAKATSSVPNGSFETWSGENPVSWSTNNDPFWITITQATPGNSGTYAAKGERVDYLSEPFIPVLTASNFAITQAYNNFQFSYKSNLVSGDIIVAYVLIYDGASTLIAAAYDTISATTSTFTQANINIPYPSSTSAATATISFTIANSSTTPSLSSYFIIDDVNLTGLATGIQEAVNVNNLKVFPVPARDWLTIKGKTNNNKAVQFVLTDATGRIVMKRNSENTSSNFIDVELNLQGISPGFYSLTMIADDKASARRIVIQ